MPFSFNPGQEQSTAAASQTNNNIPALIVPEAPTITLAPVVEAVSPFAYKNRSKSKFGIYFQSVIFLVFGVVMIAGVGLFSYQSTLKIQIANRESELVTAQAGFKKVPVDEMLRLSSRLSLINKIMNERASVRTALTVVEESINPAVIYNKFSLSKSKKDNWYDLSLTGQTTSYASLYQQVEILKSKTFAGAFPKIIISGIGPLDKKGIASFKVDASVAIEGVEPDGFTIIHKNNEASTTTEVLTSSTTPTETVVGTSSVSSQIISQ